MIFLWEAGRSSGASGSLRGAQADAGERMTAGGTGLVEEADVVMTGAGEGAGSVSEHVRTGRSWLGNRTRAGLAWTEAEGRP